MLSANPYVPRLTFVGLDIAVPVASPLAVLLDVPAGLEDFAMADIDEPELTTAAGVAAVDVIATRLVVTDGVVAITRVGLPVKVSLSALAAMIALLAVALITLKEKPMESSANWFRAGVAVDR